MSATDPIMDLLVEIAVPTASHPSEIDLLQDYITAQKAAFKACTGDTFTASNKKPTTVKRPTKAKLQGIMDKYAAEAAE